MSKEESSNKDSMRRYIWAAAVCVVLVLAVYTWRFYGQPMGAPAEFGAFGDFVGGVINPLLGFITIWLLVKSLQFQREELAAARSEMSQSNRLFESQMELQSRHNLRVQLENNLKILINKLKGATDSGLKFDVELPNYTVQYTLEHVAVALKAKKKGALSDDEIRLVDIAESWDEGPYRMLAFQVKTMVENVQSSAISLIYFSDSSLITDLIRHEVSKVYQRVGFLKILSKTEITELEVNLVLAVQDRAKTVEFPKFHQTDKPLWEHPAPDSEIWSQSKVPPGRPLDP
ncbi:MAG: hypothetical protein ACJAUN_000828 [Alcanivorax sp.]|jgi:hypothetical protein